MSRWRHAWRKPASPPRSAAPGRSSRSVSGWIASRIRTSAGSRKSRWRHCSGAKTGHASVRFGCRYVARQPERRLGGAIYREERSLAAYTAKPSEPAVDPEDADLRRTVDLADADPLQNGVTQSRTVAEMLAALA